VVLGSIYIEFVRMQCYPFGNACRIYIEFVRLAASVAKKDSTQR